MSPSSASSWFTQFHLDSNLSNLSSIASRVTSSLVPFGSGDAAPPPSARSPSWPAAAAADPDAYRKKHDDPPQSRRLLSPSRNGHDDGGVPQRRPDFNVFDTANGFENIEGVFVAWCICCMTVRVYIIFSLTDLDAFQPIDLGQPPREELERANRELRKE
ncbi:hypothetical protein HK405_006950, partial [Cladochytrium tenue]